jgi:hypothetical protein
MQPGGCVCYFILSVREANWSGGLDQRQNGSTFVAGEKRALSCSVRTKQIEKKFLSAGLV